MSAPSSLLVVYGTRPERIKLLTLLDALHDLGIRTAVVSTGQHADRRLIDAVDDDSTAAAPILDGRTASRGVQLASIITALEERAGRHQPRAVLVQGDTTSALAGALYANSNGLPLVHLEAGLRSFDRRMPEEHNRVLIDHLADLCLAPTTTARDNLLGERIADGRIVVVGNTVVDAVRRCVPRREARHGVLHRYGLDARAYILATLHRPENVDDHERLRALLEAFAGFEVPVVLPLHPRFVDHVERADLRHLLDPLVTIPPVDYPTFLALLAECAVAVSDSGGVQEEVSVLKVPVVIPRRSTERPEILGSFGTLTPSVTAMADAVARQVRGDAGGRGSLANSPSPFGWDASLRASAAIASLLDAEAPVPTDGAGVDEWCHTPHLSRGVAPLAGVPTP